MPHPNGEEGDLPDDIRAMLEDQETMSEEKLAAISLGLETRKSDAINYRKTVGIEETWKLCEDAYTGIDDANRHEFTGARMIKSTTLNAPLQVVDGREVQADHKSTAFVRLTSRYVDSGTAKIGEILLPIDDKAFSITETPVPELIQGLESDAPVIEHGVRLMRKITPPAMTQPQPQAPPQAPQQAPPQPGAPPAPPEDVPLTTKDLAEEAIQRAKTSAKKAETKIYDWMVECQHTAEMRKVMFDSCRIGVGVLKGPYPKKRRSLVYLKGKLIIKDSIVPVDTWVDPWNIFPDPACGEDIKNGDYLFERAYFSEKQVRDLKGLPGYLDTQITKAIEAGPTHQQAQSENPNTPDMRSKHPYEVWFYHGTMKREDFETLNPNDAKTLPKDRDLVYAIVTMIDKFVIRASINPLDSGSLPYHAVPWLRRPGYWAGVGVSEQIVVPQRIVNGATRALLNNAGVSGGPQIVINQKGIRPANDEWFLTSNKIWYLSEDGNSDDVNKAFMSFDIANVGDRLLKIVEYGMRLAEESTNIPLVTQGLSGKTTPETLGAVQLQDNNANQLLRNIGYSYDDYLTVPLITQYHEYYLLDPEIPDADKGEFVIHAHGSVAMVERSIQDQIIAQLVPLSLNPAYGTDPKKVYAAFAKSKHLNPAEFQYTPEEQKKIDSQPPPPIPAIEVAKIKAGVAQEQMKQDAQLAQSDAELERALADLDAQTAKEIEQIRNETARLRVKLDTDRDTVFVNAEAARARADFEANMETLRLKKELAQLDYAAKHQMSLEAVKAKLADSAMKLSAMKEMAMMDAKLRVHEHQTPSASELLKPPVQRPGKAGQGKAFSQGR